MTTVNFNSLILVAVHNEDHNRIFTYEGVVPRVGEYIADPASILFFKVMQVVHCTRNADRGTEGELTKVQVFCEKVKDFRK
jgi:hypothetical protein